MYVPSEVILCLFGFLVSIVLRICTGLHPYSGQHKPPMYGDYEAQRHWMEITVNLPPSEWYRNSSRNDLQYWGLDYPPLTAYHMYLCGLIARVIDPSYVALNVSRGFESDDHKLFMRYTVLAADVFLYVPSLVVFFVWTKRLYKEWQGPTDRKKTGEKLQDVKMTTSLAIILGLFYPGVILVDHGHFQYNCISLALLILATLFLLRKHDVVASILFCLALNYKQMELYHALPFFLYLLSTCVPKPGKTIYSGFLKLSKLALTVLLTFALIWSPFLIDLEDTIGVFQRLFPISRGVFEDKVSNVWCFLNVFYKFKRYHCDSEMLRYCTFATLTAIFPSMVDLFLRPNLKKFVPSLINSSLAFFLFGYQVHEKTILLAAIPVVLYLPNKPVQCFWFLSATTFSMLPLFVKDNLIIAFVALMGFYTTTFVVCFEYALKIGRVGNDLKSYYVGLFQKLIQSDSFDDFTKNIPILKALFLHFSVVLSLVGFILLSALSLVFEPPEIYPDLFPLLISVYSCVHFVGFFVYFTVLQLAIPQEFEDARYVKLKST